MNEKSQGVRVVSVFAAKAFEGIKNPLDAMAKELVYPNQKTIDAMNDFDTPTAVAPKNSTVEVQMGLLATQLPPFSFVVFTLTKA